MENEYYRFKFVFIDLVTHSLSFLGSTNGNDQKSMWVYPDDLNLRIVPAMLSPGNNSKHVDIKKKARPLRCKWNLQVVIWVSTAIWRVIVSILLQTESLLNL